MEPKDLFPAIFLYTDGGERIEGETRFQKLVFLFQKESDLGGLYNYDSGKFGPFSKELAGDIDRLVYAGIVDCRIERNGYGDERHTYSLTNKGIQEVQSLLDGGGRAKLFDQVEQIKQQYNGKGLKELLRYVYQNYEEYTENTRLDTDALFDPEADYGDVGADAMATTEGSGLDHQYRKYIKDVHVFKNEDATWTARDRQLGFTALGENREEAIDNLGKVIAASEGDAGHEPTDEEIRSLGVDPEQARDDSDPEIPGYMS